MMTKNLLKFAAFLVMLAVIGTSAVHAQKKFSRVVTDASLWDAVEFEAPNECEGGANECAMAMLGELNIDVGNKPLFSVYRLGEINEKSVTVVFVSHKVTEDDSVSGMLYRLELSLSDVEDKTYSLEALGRQYKCMRGRKNWTKALCP